MELQFGELKYEQQCFFCHIKIKLKKGGMNFNLTDLFKTKSIRICFVIITNKQEGKFILRISGFTFCHLGFFSFLESKYDK